MEPLADFLARLRTILANEIRLSDALVYAIVDRMVAERNEEVRRETGKRTRPS